MNKSDTSFRNSNDARILAVVLAVVLAVFAWLQYRNADQAGMTNGDPVLSASQLPALGTSAAATKCAELQFANIEQMVKDGYLAQDGVAKAKEQAIGLCISQTR